MWCLSLLRSDFLRPLRAVVRKNVASHLPGGFSSKRPAAVASSPGDLAKDENEPLKCFLGQAHGVSSNGASMHIKSRYISLSTQHRSQHHPQEDKHDQFCDIVVFHLCLNVIASINGSIPFVAHQVSSSPNACCSLWHLPHNGTAHLSEGFSPKPV